MRLYARIASGGCLSLLLLLALASIASASGFFSKTATPTISTSRYPWRSESPSPRGPTVSPSPSPSVTPSKYPLLNVYDFGAVGDGVQNDTDAIQNTLDACVKFGGCTVWLPGNGTYLCYPISISSDNTDLKIDGEVMLPLFKDAEVHWYKDDRGYRPWLVLNNAYKYYSEEEYDIDQWEHADIMYNITIRGFGRINGQGASGWWTADHSDNRPFLLYISDAQNVTLQDVTLYEAPYMHVIPFHVDGMDVHNLTIMTDGISPNTDGIDPAYSTNIHIHNTTISNGDDCIAVKSNCSNILVENCTFANGHGASIGSTALFTHNVTFRNIVFYNTTYGARVKSRNYEPGAIWDVTYDNLELHFVKTAIEITQFYEPSNNPDANNTITNINITNVVAYDTTDATFNFNCSDNHPCVNMRLNNITSFDPFKVNRYLYGCISFHASVNHIKPPINGTVNNELNCDPANPEYQEYFEAIVASSRKHLQEPAEEVQKADAIRQRVNLVAH